jgi:prepilin-type processing-associated H-X9-DG protein
MKRLRRRSSAGVGLADLLVVAVVILLGLMALAGCWSSGGRSRETANRVKCAMNLRQVGMALATYANQNGGAYPRTTFVGGTAVTPTWGTGSASTDPFAPGGPAPNDVTAALFLLIRTQQITPQAFICPSSNHYGWDFGGGTKSALDWSNWPGAEGVRKHLSYSYQNPYPDAGAEQSGFALNSALIAEFAVAADMNPGRANGNDVLAVTSTSSMKAMRQGNSRNHRGDGQNILFGDGHVEFNSNPFVGVQRDMIYARRAAATGYVSSDVRNSPLDLNDSVLLPADE